MGCLNCGEKLEQLPKKKEKIFCDSTCRSNYWQKKNRLGKLGLSPPTDTAINIGKEKQKKETKKQKDEMPDPSNKGAYLQWLRSQK